MGVGTPINILEGSRQESRFFDCVYPSETDVMDMYIPTMES